MDSLVEYIKAKALSYWNETADDTEKIDSFPLSIVDYVIEYAMNQCHFPSHFTEEHIVDVLTKHRNTLAMACVDVYSKAGAEGEKMHVENGISRTYDDAWVSKRLTNNLPNYVKVFG